MTSARASIKLTAFQADEVANGLEVDRDDGNPEWGWIDYDSRPGQIKRTGTLHITDVNGALYRISSCRDIWRDNWSGGFDEYGSGARSLTKLTGTLVKALGGATVFKPEYRKYI
jgi:hypothetical protein